MSWAWLVVAASLAFGLYAYVGYPLILAVLAAFRHRERWEPFPDGEWPSISISLPAYNERHQIADTLNSLLALDYPAERRQIVVVSDASDDGTDDIVERYAERGVLLLRQPERRGKTAAEQLASEHLTGEIVVNTDASIRIRPEALKKLIAPFRDPRIGLASGRDVSIGRETAETNQGEAGYVGYEMAVRDLETRVHGIVGASGCFYAIRKEYHRVPLPANLSRDFAAALHVRERGSRPVSVSEAVCLVPRTASLAAEYQRKVRTMARGMETLIHKRSLLDPLQYGRFAWMLASHKVARWLLPWAALAGLGALTVLAPSSILARILLIAPTAVILLGIVGWTRADTDTLPPVLAVPAFLLISNVAAMRALVQALRGDQRATWEPTRRETPTSGTSAPG